uniref:Mucin-22-like n=1 Tax=Saccoglossus kowalevskii TaxID=10224 RepID=A0ABM0MUY1_SACKO|nr:PREDICTED: mucin-22-like [Saccoglossus kowalevskii]
MHTIKSGALDDIQYIVTDTEETTQTAIKEISITDLKAEDETTMRISSTAPQILDVERTGLKTEVQRVSTLSTPMIGKSTAKEAEASSLAATGVSTTVPTPSVDRTTANSSTTSRKTTYVVEMKSIIPHIGVTTEELQSTLKEITLQDFTAEAIHFSTAKTSAQPTTALLEEATVTDFKTIASSIAPTDGSTELPITQFDDATTTEVLTFKDMDDLTTVEEAIVATSVSKSPYLYASTETIDKGPTTSRETSDIVDTKSIIPRIGVTTEELQSALKEITLPDFTTEATHSSTVRTSAVPTTALLEEATLTDYITQATHTSVAKSSTQPTTAVLQEATFTGSTTSKTISDVFETMSIIPHIGVTTEEIQSAIKEITLPEIITTFDASGLITSDVEHSTTSSETASTTSATSTETINGDFKTEASRVAATDGSTKLPISHFDEATDFTTEATNSSTVRTSAQPTTALLEEATLTVQSERRANGYLSYFTEVVTMFEASDLTTSDEDRLTTPIVPTASTSDTSIETIYGDFKTEASSIAATDGPTELPITHFDEATTKDFTTQVIHTKGAKSSTQPTTALLEEAVFTVLTLKDIDDFTTVEEAIVATSVSESPYLYASTENIDKGSTTSRETSDVVETKSIIPHTGVTTEELQSALKEITLLAEAIHFSTVKTSSQPTTSLLEEATVTDFKTIASSIAPTDGSTELPITQFDEATTIDFTTQAIHTSIKESSSQSTTALKEEATFTDFKTEASSIAVTDGPTKLLITQFDEATDLSTKSIHTSVAKPSTQPTTALIEETTFTGMASPTTSRKISDVVETKSIIPHTDVTTEEFQSAVKEITLPDFTAEAIHSSTVKTSAQPTTSLLEEATVTEVVTMFEASDLTTSDVERLTTSSVPASTTSATSIETIDGAEAIHSSTVKASSQPTTALLEEAIVTDFKTEVSEVSTKLPISHIDEATTTGGDSRLQDSAAISTPWHQSPFGELPGDPQKVGAIRQEVDSLFTKGAIHRIGDPTLSPGFYPQVSVVPKTTTETQLAVPNFTTEATHSSTVRKSVEPTTALLEETTLTDFKTEASSIAPTDGSTELPITQFDEATTTGSTTSRMTTDVDETKYFIPHIRVTTDELQSALKEITLPDFTAEATHSNIAKTTLLKETADFTSKSIHSSIAETSPQSTTSITEVTTLTENGSIGNRILYRVYRNRSVPGGKTVRQVVVPKLLRTRVMEIAHDSIFGGHMGIKETEDRIVTSFYLSGLHPDVTSFCHVMCARRLFQKDQL